MSDTNTQKYKGKYILTIKNLPEEPSISRPETLQVDLGSKKVITAIAFRPIDAYFFNFTLNGERIDGYKSETDLVTAINTNPVFMDLGIKARLAEFYSLNWDGGFVPENYVLLTAHKQPVAIDELSLEHHTNISAFIYTEKNERKQHSGEPATGNLAEYSSNVVLDTTEFTV